ncbi:hypothetical protein [Streptobacillus moniliformis]|uniref:hypothetical protein n=1 Tax=Streptobacillus moniliformis TaxID=34105 RepID=UPI0007E3AABF|nr:hypothetical protein [Streptobacillus moniliformis]
MDKKINWSDAIEFEKEKINKGFFEYLFTDINEFKLEKDSEEKTKKGIISAILENKNIKLLILILFLLSLLLTFGKLV